MQKLGRRHCALPSVSERFTSVSDISSVSSRRQTRRHLGFPGALENNFAYVLVGISVVISWGIYAGVGLGSGLTYFIS